MRALFVLALFISTQASAFCFNAAGAKYNLSPQLLKAIAFTESALDPQAVNHNEATSDIGLMQINTWWLPSLSQLGISESDLWQPCTNVMAGAWILAQNMATTSDPWLAVGAYNAGFSKNKQRARARYTDLVKQNLTRLFP